MNKLRKNIKYLLFILPVVLLLQSCKQCSTDGTGGDVVPAVSYEGIFFAHPFWFIATEKLDEGYFFIEAKTDKSLFLTTFITREISPEGMIKRYFNNMQSSELELMTEPAINSKFGRYDCVSSKFRTVNKGLTVYGIASAFNAGGKTILTIKQADSETALETGFAQIEETFFVENSKD